MKALGSCYKRNIEKKKKSNKEETLSHPKSRKAPQQFPFPAGCGALQGWWGLRIHIYISVISCIDITKYSFYLISKKVHGYNFCTIIFAIVLMLLIRNNREK